MIADALTKPQDVRSFKRQLSHDCLELCQQFQRAQRGFGWFVKDLARQRLLYTETPEKLRSLSYFWETSGLSQMQTTTEAVLAQVVCKSCMLCVCPPFQ